MNNRFEHSVSSPDFNWATPSKSLKYHCLSRRAWSYHMNIDTKWNLNFGHCFHDYLLKSDVKSAPPPQPAIQYIPKTFSPRIKQLECAVLSVVLRCRMHGVLPPHRYTSL